MGKAFSQQILRFKYYHGGTENTEEVMDERSVSSGLRMME